jgi:hypothetical protein
MAKRAFLIPLVAAIAAATQGQAAVVDKSESVTTTVDPDKATSITPLLGEGKHLALPSSGQDQRVLMPNGDDLFGFILRRTSAGHVVAQHESHASHSSHSSHRSHYSSR